MKTPQSFSWLSLIGAYWQPLVVVCLLWAIGTLAVHHIAWDNVLRTSGATSTTASAESIAAAYGDAFGAVNALFTGLAMVGVFIVLKEQVAESRASESQKITFDIADKLTSLASMKAQASLHVEIRAGNITSDHLEFSNPLARAIALENAGLIDKRLFRLLAREQLRARIDGLAIEVGKAKSENHPNLDWLHVETFQIQLGRVGKIAGIK